MKTKKTKKKTKTTTYDCGHEGEHCGHECCTDHNELCAFDKVEDHLVDLITDDPILGVCLPVTTWALVEQAAIASVETGLSLKHLREHIEETYKSYSRWLKKNVTTQLTNENQKTQSTNN